MKNKNPHKIDIENIDPIYRAFARLPRLTEPPPQPDKESVSRLAIIPIFLDHYVRMENLPAIVQSAIYSRASCLKNTDAVANGINVKLYIQDNIGNRLAAQLIRNGVDPDEDAIYFDSTIHRSWNYLGKKTYCYYDPQLADYEQVIGWDADIFFPPQANNSHLFETFAQMPEFIHYAKTSVMTPDWKEYLYRHFRPSGLSVDEILHQAKVKIPTYPIKNPSGSLWVIPSKSAHKHHSEMLAWIKAASPLLGCDEVTLAFASHHFKWELRSIESDYGIGIQSIGAYWSNPSLKMGYIHMFVPHGEDERCIKYMQEIT